MPLLAKAAQGWVTFKTGRILKMADADRRAHLLHFGKNKLLTKPSKPSGSKKTGWFDLVC